MHLKSLEKATRCEKWGRLMWRRLRLSSSAATYWSTFRFRLLNEVEIQTSSNCCKNKCDHPISRFNFLAGNDVEAARAFLYNFLLGGNLLVFLSIYIPFPVIGCSLNSKFVKLLQEWVWPTNFTSFQVLFFCGKWCGGGSRFPLEMP